MLLRIDLSGAAGFICTLIGPCRYWIGLSLNKCYALQREEMQQTSFNRCNTWINVSSDSTISLAIKKALRFISSITFWKKISNKNTQVNLPGEPKKKSPLRLLLILQQCMGIFVQNFTRLLSDRIYTLSPSFIEIFLKLTKLHSFNHDNPHFTHWKLCCLPR